LTQVLTLKVLMINPKTDELEGVHVYKYSHAPASPAIIVKD